MGRYTAVLLALAMAACLLSQKPARVSAQVRSCGQVLSRVTACVPYVFTDGSGAIPSRCCPGVRALNNLARTTADRRQACTCLKNLVATLDGINEDTIASLPGKCNVDLPFTITSDIDCNSIS